MIGGSKGLIEYSEYPVVASESMTLRGKLMIAKPP